MQICGQCIDFRVSLTLPFKTFNFVLFSSLHIVGVYNLVWKVTNNNISYSAHLTNTFGIKISDIQCMAIKTIKIVFGGTD